MAIFIFNLNTKNAMCSCHFFINFLPETFHQCQVIRIIAAQFISFFQQPVRKTAISCLSMRPRSNTKPHMHLPFLAQFQKPMQIALTCKIKDTFFFLMMNPENIGCYDIHATGSHFPDFFFPFRFRASGKMKLPHHWKNCFFIFE